MMRTTGAVITEIVEAWAGLGTGWVRLEEIAKRAGLSDQELQEAIGELIENDSECQITEQPFRHRLTAWDRDSAPIVGGDRMHLIRWGA